MKLNQVFLVIAFIMLFGCHDDSSSSKEIVQFELELLERLTGDAGRTSAASDIPPGAKLRLSIKTTSDITVFSLQDFDLLRVGESVISPPIELASGGYWITDFMIISSNNEVLFATPKNDSPFSKFVSNPLDRYFDVSNGGVNKIRMEVIDVSASAPEEFGYVSFNVGVVHPLSIAVFAATESGAVLTDANLIIEKGQDLVQANTLLPQVNTIGLRLGRDEVYTMRVSRPGYLSYHRDFTYEQLILETGGSLNITLMPGMTIVTPFYNMPGHLNFNFGGPPGTQLTIDWGDGTMEVNPNNFEHLFAPGRRYTIHITGELDNVTSFGSAYNDFEDFDPTLLTGLYSFDFTLCDMPKVIDLSRSTRLQTLAISQCRGTEIIVAPSSETLETVAINHSHLSTAIVSDAIRKVFENATAHEIFSGTFDLRLCSINCEPEELENQLAGPPDSDAMSKLVALRDVYGWTIIPEL